LKDPDELFDISRENLDLIKTLSNKLAEIKDDNARRRKKYFHTEEKETQSVRKIEDESIEQLKALGYLQ
jgi:hypothetical protein